MLVVDASVLVTALADDGADGDRARSRLRGETLVVPELADVEVLSVLRRQLAAGRLDARRAALALADLRDLPARRVAHLPLLHGAWALRANLSVYDAVYVALADALGAVFLTGDARLARAPDLPCPVEVLVPG